MATVWKVDATAVTLSKVHGVLETHARIAPDSLAHSLLAEVVRLRSYRRAGQRLVMLDVSSVLTPKE